MVEQQPQIHQHQQAMVETQAQALPLLKLLLESMFMQNKHLFTKYIQTDKPKEQ